VLVVLQAATESVITPVKARTMRFIIPRFQRPFTSAACSRVLTIGNDYVLRLSDHCDALRTAAVDIHRQDVTDCSSRRLTS
jgi:hypothetical protein